MILLLYVLGMVPPLIACQNVGKSGWGAVSVVLLLWPLMSWTVLFSAFWEAARLVLGRTNG